MFFRTIKRQGEYIHELEEHINLLNKTHKNEKKNMLDDFVMTINEIQDVDAIKEKTEEEKKQLRDSIINAKRTKYVTKLIELSNFIHHR